jgi:hypothetical protein
MENSERIAQLEAQNAQLTAQLATQSNLRLAVSKKGCISVYGLNARFPVSLYKGQWERLNAIMPRLMAFAKAHESELSVKPTKTAEEGDEAD